MTREWQGLGTRLDQLHKHSEEAKVRGVVVEEEGVGKDILWCFF